MGKKANHAEHENLERWVVSYADFMTLLFAVFTALYAMANAELMSMEDVAKAISEGFKEQSLLSGIESVFQGKSAPADNPNPLSKEVGRGDGIIGNFESLTYSPGEVKDAEKTVKELAGTIDEQNAEQKAAQKKTFGPDLGEAEGSDTPTRATELAVQSRGIKVSFDSRLLFHSGTAELKPESLAKISAIGERLKKFSGRNLIQIEGHTDNQPIHSSQYPSNWELSTARASTVVRELIKEGFDPKYLSAAGFADSRPIGDNRTPEGRAKNRRIDIIIYSHQMTMGSDPKKQYKKEHDIITNAPESSTTNKNPHTIVPKTQTPNLDKELMETQSAKNGLDKGVKVIFVKEGADGKPSDTKVVQPKPQLTMTKSPKKVVVKNMELLELHSDGSGASKTTAPVEVTPTKTFSGKQTIKPVAESHH